MHDVAHGDLLERPVLSAHQEGAVGGEVLGRAAEVGLPVALHAQQGEDLVSLDLEAASFDLSDRGVEGNPPAPPIDVFAATDRGAYRAGETAFATVMTRDERAQAIDERPRRVLQRLRVLCSLVTEAFPS